MFKAFRTTSILLGGAALALTGCQEMKKQPKTPPSAKLSRSQGNLYKDCTLKALNPNLGSKDQPLLATAFNITGATISTDIKFKDQLVTTVVVNAAGQSTDKPDVKQLGDLIANDPATAARLSAGKKAIAGCYSKAKASPI